MVSSEYALFWHPRTILKRLLAEWPNVSIMEGAYSGQIEYPSCQSGVVSQR